MKYEYSQIKSPTLQEGLTKVNKLAQLEGWRLINVVVQGRACNFILEREIK